MFKEARVRACVHDRHAGQHLGYRVEIDYGFKNLLIRVFNDEKVFYTYVPKRLRGDVPFFIGHDRDGEMVSVDLAKSEPHMYIAGESSGGKSTILRVIITNLILHNDVEL